jgi:RNA polymerase sigma-70 factor (sigma-E family)
MGLFAGVRPGGESLILSSAQRLSPLLRSRRGVAGMSRQEEVTVGTAIEDDAAAFHEFFERHYAELARLAALLTGEADAADDLAADALVVLWRQWDRMRAAEHPVAYARGVVANLARSRIRSAVRERRRIALFWSQRSERVEAPDVPAVLDLREALQRLPFGKRACVVLRYAFDLSEKDTAEALGVSVGTVKSQTSRGVAALERILAPPAEPEAVPAAKRPGPAGQDTARILGAPAPPGRARTRTGRGV